MPFVKSSTSLVADDPDFEAPESKQKILPYTEQRKQIKLDQHADQNAEQGPAQKTPRASSAEGRYIFTFYNCLITVL